MQDNGWQHSAPAWITAQGVDGDFSRRFVLDRPMLERVIEAQPRDVLDLGCGEGRFCRMLAARGLGTTGIEPTPALLAEARRRHPEGHYLDARAEALPFTDHSFDLVVTYLSLIDIDDHLAAFSEAIRVLRPKGRLLIANLTSHSTAASWQEGVDGLRHFAVADYLTARQISAEWAGIKVRNWHRPLQDYMQPLLAAGLRLTWFAEPRPGPDLPAEDLHYRRAAWLMAMEWQKPS